MDDTVPLRAGTGFRHSTSSRERIMFSEELAPRRSNVIEPADGNYELTRRHSHSNDSFASAPRRMSSVARRQALLLPRTLSTSEAIEDAIAAEVAHAGISLDPSELLPESLGEWRDRSLSMQMLKRNHSVTASRRRTLANVGGPSRAHFDDAMRLSKAVAADLQNTAALTLDAPRHRYTTEQEFLPAETGPKEDEDKGSRKELPEDYYSALSVAPQATLVHIVRLYHRTLVEHGLDEDAKKIADMLSELEAEEEDVDAELTGLDLLLKNGMLRYLRSIQPHLPPIPTQVIKFKNVSCSITVQVDPGYESIHTKLVECCKGPFKESPLQQVELLKDATGYVMPGTLTLVLGSPGSGKSILPSILAGRDLGPGSTVEGRVTYNGNELQSVNYQRLVAFVEPEDYHYATLTVRETMEFARDCSQHLKPKGFTRELKEILGDALKVGQDPKLEVNLRMLGLKRVEQKPVGNAFMPTLTDDEVHRVSVAEMIAGTYAVYVFDQLNVAIDDALAFDLVTAVRILARVRKTSVIASLIRPSQEVVDLFDRIILFNRGVIVYQGPRQDAMPYFESLGYFKPYHVSIAEFLEEVATPDGVQYLQPGFPRLDLDGFEAAYKNSDTFKDVCRVVDSRELIQEYWVQGTQPLGVHIVRSNPNKGDESSIRTIASVDVKEGSLTAASMDNTDVVQTGDEVVAVGGYRGQLDYVKFHPAKLDSFMNETPDSVRLQFERPHDDWEKYERNPQFQRTYVQDWWPEFILLFKRDVTVTWRNKLALMIRAVQVVILALFMGFLFFRVKRDADQFNMGLFRGVSFVTLLDMTLFSLGQLPGLFQERPVYYKQQGAHFYRPSTYLFAKLCGSFIFSLAEATTWTIIVYFLTDLSLTEGGWHFWVFYVVIVLTVVHGAAMVRCLSAVLPDLAAASGVLGLLVAIFILFAGFLLPRRICPDYWIWAYYIDPLQWGITALLVNEFNSDSYKVLCRDVPDLSKIPQCNGQPDATIGHAYLSRLQFYTDTKWIGVSVAVIIGWILLWTLLNYRALVRIRHKPRRVVTPTGVANARRTEEQQEFDLEFSSSVPVKTLSLSAIPVTLSWHELSYNILVPSIRKEISILNCISGWASPGEMVALLGGSGAGKTTLLNCLAGRKVTLGRIGGQILVNAYPRVQAAFIRVAGYVDPIDGYQQFMTVREVVAFNAAHSISKQTTPAQRSEFVDEVLELTDLKGVANTLVKSLGSNYLTLTETRRVMIASELGRNPSIFFMDEPFRNLDATSSLHLCQTMKHIADTGRSIVAAVLMPSQRIFGQFTSVQILKRGGEVVYFGSVGRDCELVKAYFDSIPGTPICSQRTSIAHYAIDIIGDGAADRKAARDYALEYRTNDLALYNHIQLQRVKRSKGRLGPEIVDSSSGASFGTRAKYILKELQLYYWRNTPYSWGRITSSIMIALLLGSVYFNIQYDTLIRMNVRSSSLFITTLLLAITNVNAVLPQSIIQRQNYSRTKARGQFNLFLYAVGFSAGEFQYLGISTLLNSAIFCLMSQMAVDTAANFFLYWLVALLLTIALTFLGVLLASIAGLPQVASMMVTIMIGAWTSTSGVVIPKKIIPPQGVWIYWTNPLQYALNSLTSVSFYCDVDSPQCMDGGRIPACKNDTLTCPKCDCTRLTDQGNVFAWTTLRNNRTLDHSRIGLDILALVGFAVLFRFLTIIVWRWKDARAAKKAL